MSGFKKFFIVMTVLLIASVTILLATAASFKPGGTDTVKINDIAQSAKEDWRSFDGLRDRFPGTDILILDNNNSRVFVTSESIFAGIDTPLDAISDHMLVLAVNDGEIFLGTVIIKDPARSQYEQLQTAMALTTGAIVIIMVISYASFLYYVNKNITKPFNRMKEFAASIAQGNLDEPLKMEQNNMFGVFTESFDVMREELKASRNREIALKIKEKELVASLSHDLKTPVTGIRVICELLEVKVEDEYVKGKIVNIEQKTKQIDVLLSDLLSSTLDDLGEMNVDPCEESSGIIGKLVEEHDVNKKTTSPLPEVPACIILVDKNRLSQVIGNIISNSYKYADTKIDIAYKFEGRFLKMDISDYGPGVPDEEIDLITDKFYRGKTNTKGKDGSGLGLYIAGELMKKIGGQLICSNRKDGFTVTILIPLA